MASHTDDVKSELISLLKQFTKTEMEITDSIHIMNDLDLDSVMVMELMMELEDHFDISIPLNSLPDVNTVADLATEISTLKDQT